VRREQIVMVDQAGVIYRGRETRMNRYKAEFATNERSRTLSEAMSGADVFLGVSGPNLVTADMVRSMADRPIVLAMANPDPEISYGEAKAARPDVIVATGRSDCPNQVNNVLGFPYIFRGALDVQAKAINTGSSRPRLGGAREGVRSRQRSEGVRQRALPLRARLHHPQAVRPSRAAAGGFRGR
jgi:malate dehydrogenase (oxaloacetate-decarboxylating)(NADP+)